MEELKKDFSEPYLEEREGLAVSENRAAANSSVLSPWIAKPAPSVLDWTEEGLETFKDVKVSLKNLCDLCVLTIPSEEDVSVLKLNASGTENLEAGESSDGDPWRPAAVLRREEQEAAELRAAPISQLVGGDVGTTPTVKEKEGDVCNGEGEVCKEQGAVCKEKELEGAKEMNKKKIKENRDQNPNRC